MIRAGTLDRRITIQHKTVTTSPDGGQIETWADLATVWANARPLKSDEKFGDQQLIATSLTTFTIRYRSDLTVQDVIKYNGRIWDILDIREVGRRQGLELDTKARTDTPPV